LFIALEEEFDAFAFGGEGLGAVAFVHGAVEGMVGSRRLAGMLRGS